jgi:HlyD family secretion protein
MRKWIIATAVLLLVGGGAYGYYWYTKAPPAPTIATARVTRGDVAETVGATGTLQAVTTVQVGTQVSGTIRELNADFNSLVRKGQVVARLDPSLFQTQIEQARANLVRAEADLERLRVATDDSRTKLRRARELAEKKLIAQTELEAADVAVRSAEAQIRSQDAAVSQSQASLRQAQVNLAHTVIEAPIDGLVISRNVDVGQTVAASMSAPTLFLLAADLTKMQVIASLDESDVGRIRPGQVVRFRVDAFPNEEFTGAVTQVRLQPTTVQNVVTYATVIDVPNPQLKLKPGMTANVNVEIARRDNVLRVPNSALRFRPTNEIFEALGQVPPALGRGGRGGGEGEPLPGMRTPQPSQAPPTSAAPAPSSAPAASQTPRRGEGAGNAGASSTADASGEGGRGRGFGRGGRGNLSERLAAMAPDERERFLERMRARGLAPSPDGRTEGGRQGGPNAQASQDGQGGERRQRRPEAVPAAAPAAQERSMATNIDALFGPLPSTETAGQVWLNQGGKLNRVRLRLGISDGQQSELLQVFDNTKLEEGTEVVTSITLGAQRAAVTGGSAFPGLGTGRQGFPGAGGNRGGGGGNRGGGRGQ